MSPWGLYQHRVTFVPDESQQEGSALKLLTMPPGHRHGAMLTTTKMEGRILLSTYRGPTPRLGGELFLVCGRARIVSWMKQATVRL